ncbi:hypothetical protein [Thalassolituus marinus]|uniref:Uncharacterized protein n=1 Tax=Thalassolituus marinus TaxID=671053 RepID=A0ABS7ZQT9_9GAMM|nr:hypothetical protein [Thalassolituus marinus]MCA6064060.1 hypothetical protein [Thalassolituus marinus]
MISEWVPGNPQSGAIDVATVKRFATLAEAIKEDADAVREAIGEQTLQQAGGWLKLDETAWQSVISALEEKELFPLAEFFTIAENAFSGWQCGAKNPAIWVFRYLKEQQKLPEKALIRELKGRTDNRFIPYGSVL